MDENEQVKKPENAIVYVRLSDTLDDAAGRLSLADQEAKARKRGADLGWGMQAETVIENDLTGSGKRSLASAYKTKKIVHPDGRVTFEDRRPRWREVLASLCTGEADGLVVVPALRYPGAQPEAVDQVGIAPVPTQVVQCF